jgi:large subunit ribosomal protein LP0
MSAGERKQGYFNKLNQLLVEHNKIMIVGADNVGSSQMQRIRKSLRGKATLLMGKNTMVRKAVRGLQATNAQLTAIMPHVKGNVGLLFCKGDLSEIKKVISENKVPAPARVGAISPIDVIVPAGPTGMEPTQTSFLQALNIPSKIVKGQVEISNDVKLLSVGQKVGSSESALLQKLNIKPFQYGLVILTVYDEGAIYEPAVLDLTEPQLLSKFHSGVRNLACVSLALHYPTVAALPHLISNGFKNVLAIGLATNFSFERAEKFKKAALSAPAVTAAPASAPAAKGKAEPEPKKKEEPKEEEDEDMGLGLFD